VMLAADATTATPSEPPLVQLTTHVWNNQCANSGVTIVRSMFTVHPLVKLAYKGTKIAASLGTLGFSTL